MHKPDPIIITASTLRQFQSCERQIWLDNYGDPTEREIVEATPSQQRGILHERLVQQKIGGDLRPVRAAAWHEMVAATQQLMAEGVAAIWGACLETPLPDHPQVSLRGKIDLLRRLRGGMYQPIEIKVYQTADKADWLQLDFYHYLLGLYQGDIFEGELWLGSGNPWDVYRSQRRDYDEPRLLTAIQQVLSILDTPDTPPIFFGKHCDGCGWASACRQQAEATHDIALIPSLRRDTWAQMHAENVHTLEDVTAIPESELKRFKGIGAVTSKELHNWSIARLNRQPHVFEPIPQTCALPGIMLDIETCLNFGDEGIPWSFGWCDCEGRTQVAIVSQMHTDDQLVLPDGQIVQLIRDFRDGWRLVADDAETVPGHVYHWTGYETGVLKKTAVPDVIDRLKPRMHDLHATFKRTAALPVPNRSIKTISAYLGYSYPETNRYDLAWEYYVRWLRDGDDYDLMRAVDYQRADVEALLIAWQWITSQ